MDEWEAKVKIIMERRNITREVRERALSALRATKERVEKQRAEKKKISQARLKYTQRGANRIPKVPANNYVHKK